jgi:hypothetical protein
MSGRQIEETNQMYLINNGIPKSQAGRNARDFQSDDSGDSQPDGVNITHLKNTERISPVYK